MSHAALTARYRPQSFAEVAGQSVVKSILSRASLEDRIAPAYIFSGTRGVGKTTLARIFAKAVNCRRAPGAEPCNECDQCRAITLGSSVDVVEMDGASNTGVDDVRRLKEIVGYAPMEGRYKIFIIDEAHMLSKSAFNALLKTLEEPPPRVTFILATTEPHKFPATIVSRCQHYVFKSLSEKELIAHLCAVLRSESVEYEESATRLIARRGAGSVRDSLSLLDQVLALGDGSLTESSVRSVLGLAGTEMQRAVLSAIRDGDCLRLSSLLGELLDQGLDMGFFLRELSGIWRDLFILGQSGVAALPVLDLPQTEADACLELCRGFTLPHIHACWQMTLEGQRRVRDSLEPASALELLLLNLAMLPRLLSLENITAGSGAQISSPPPEATHPARSLEAERPAQSPDAAHPAPQDTGAREIAEAVRLPEAEHPAPPPEAARPARSLEADRPAQSPDAARLAPQDTGTREIAEAVRLPEAVRPAQSPEADRPAQFPDAASPAQPPEAERPASPARSAVDARAALLVEATPRDMVAQAPPAVSQSTPAAPKRAFALSAPAAPASGEVSRSGREKGLESGLARAEEKQFALSAPAAPASGAGSRSGRKKGLESRQARPGEKQADKEEILKNSMVQEVIRRFDARYLDHGRR
ncbi:MAG: DNA polymerase III subunit gamma/tau [Desulfovibrio sp.]|nr:DNA polymerase III subunit gamma/tau [Desulfovibrio sp.]